MADELEEKLREKLGAECDSRLAGKISEFGGLLTKSAAVLLLCRENGIEIEKRIPISQAGKNRLPFTFQGKVDKIFPAQEYAGGASRSLRLHVSQDGHEATVVLWNEQAKVAQGTLHAGDLAEFSGAYFRDGEITLGKNGSLRVLSSAGRQRMDGLSHGLCSVEGVVKEVEPDYHYLDKKTGEKKRLSSFLLCQGEDCRRVVVWEPSSQTSPKEGETVLVENVVFKNSELHFNSGSRMARECEPEEKSGTVKSVKIEGGKVAIGIDGKRYAMSLEDALALLRVREVPPGVAPSTVISIKGDSLAGKNVRYRVDGERLACLVV